jgi:hypothetical protein
MQYLPAVAVEQSINLNNPAKIAIRARALSVIDAHMRQDEAIKIQYASKYAGIQNSYKKWQGEILGMTRTGGLAKIRAYDSVFQARVNANPAFKNKYGTLLSDLKNLYTQFAKFSLARDYQSEVIGRIELFTIASNLNTLVNARQNNGEAGLQKALPGVKEKLADIYKEYNPGLDKEVFAALMEMYASQENPSFLAPELMAWINVAGGDYKKLADLIFRDTELDNGPFVLEALEKNPVAFLDDYKKDRANDLLLRINDAYNKEVATNLTGLQASINGLQRTYMQAQMEVFKEKLFYPDANSTLRVAYGQVKGYTPRNGVKYDHHTYLEGVMEKYVPGDYEFDVPAKLIDLYKKKDFGPYGEKGKMPVCVIATNHTTGGNSGSPALDAYGNLVGLNFDRAWEGTMSDLNYDPTICRNIMVDIRYVLFIIDKFAGATNLISEMKLVRPKSKKI